MCIFDATPISKQTFMIETRKIDIQAEKSQQNINQINLWKKNLFIKIARHNSKHTLHTFHIYISKRRIERGVCCQLYHSNTKNDFRVTSFTNRFRCFSCFNVNKEDFFIDSN